MGHLLPRLSLQALQSFSQSCTAARRAVRSLPDPVLVALAQVRGLLMFALTHSRSSSEMQLVQAEGLPVRAGPATADRIDALARQIAAVTQGVLQPAARVCWSEAPCHWQDARLQMKLTPLGDAIAATSGCGALQYLLRVAPGEQHWSGHQVRLLLTSHASVCGCVCAHICVHTCPRVPHTAAAHGRVQCNKAARAQKCPAAEHLKMSCECRSQSPRTGGECRES